MKKNGGCVEDSVFGQILQTFGVLSDQDRTWLSSTDPFDKSIRNIIHIKEKENKIFTWTGNEGTLEEMVREAKPSLSKKQWEWANHEVTKELAIDLLQKNNYQIQNLIKFLMDNNYIRSNA